MQSPERARTRMEVYAIKVTQSFSADEINRLRRRKFRSQAQARANGLSLGVSGRSWASLENPGFG